MQFLLLLEKFPILKKIIGVLTLGLTWWASIKLAENRGEEKGKDKERLDAAQDTIEIVKEAKAVHEEVNNYSDDDHVDLLQK